MKAYDHIADNEKVVRTDKIRGKTGGIPGNQAVLYREVFKSTWFPEDGRGERDGIAPADGSKNTGYGPVPERVFESQPFLHGGMLSVHQAGKEGMGRRARA